MSNLKKLLIIIAGTIILCGISITSQAALHDRGRGLIYDDVLDITWMQDANLAATEDFGRSWYNLDPSGLMHWSTAYSYISEMNNNNYLGYSDWSLPSLDLLSHMYANNLGGTGQAITGDVGPFKNIQLGYWSNEWRYINNRAYFLCFSSCFDANSDLIGPGQISYGDPNPSFTHFATWAVRSGDVPTVVPEPISSILFIAGGTLIAGRRYIRRKKSA